MRIQQLQGQQALDALIIDSIAFQSSHTYAQVFPNLLAMRNGEQPILYPRRQPEDPLTLWGAVEDGEVIAAATAIDFLQNFDGKSAKMVGIASVCSLPEKRRGGAVREIFRSMLKDAREKGVLLSYLYPFSSAFYARFGYETAVNVTMVALPIAAFEQHSHTGHVKAFKPELLADVRRVYDAFSPRYNGMLVRTEQFQWRVRLLEHDPVKELRYTYIWYDEQDQPGAYLSFETLQEGESKVMNITELCYISPAALRGIFAFIRRFSAQYQQVRLTLPQDEYLLSYFAEHNPISFSTKTRGQVLILNVAQALHQMRHPQGKGEYSLFVEDAFLPDNQGLYHVAYNGADVRVELTQGNVDQADISLSINAFSVMAFGTIDLRQALCRQDVTLNANRQVLEQVFVQKPGMILDFF